MAGSTVYWCFQRHRGEYEPSKYHWKHYTMTVQLSVASLKNLRTIVRFSQLNRFWTTWILWKIKLYDYWLCTRVFTQILGRSVFNTAVFCNWCNEINFRTVCRINIFWISSLQDIFMILKKVASAVKYTKTQLGNDYVAMRRLSIFLDILAITYSWLCWMDYWHNSWATWLQTPRDVRYQLWTRDSLTSQSLLYCTPLPMVTTGN